MTTRTKLMLAALVFAFAILLTADIAFTLQSCTIGAP